MYVSKFSAPSAPRLSSSPALRSARLYLHRSANDDCAPAQMDGAGRAIPGEMLRAHSALPLDDAICCASNPFDVSPLPPLRAALFVNS